MKPISVRLPFLGLVLRIEAAPARRRAVRPPPPARVLTLSLRETLDARVLQDIGLDHSRRD